MKERFKDFLEFAGNFLFGVLPILAFLGVVICILALLFAWICGPASKPERCVAFKSRFVITENIGLSMWITRDEQTGKYYLVNYHGGIVEIEPTKAEAK